MLAVVEGWQDCASMPKFQAQSSTSRVEKLSYLGVRNLLSFSHLQERQSWYSSGHTFGGTRVVRLLRITKLMVGSLV